MSCFLAVRLRCEFNLGRDMHREKNPANSIADGVSSGIQQLSNGKSMGLSLGHKRHDLLKDKCTLASTKRTPQSPGEG